MDKVRQETMSQKSKQLAEAKDLSNLLSTKERASLRGHVKNEPLASIG